MFFNETIVDGREVISKVKSKFKINNKSSSLGSPSNLVSLDQNLKIAEMGEPSV